METLPSPTESVLYKVEKLLAIVRDRMDVLDFNEKRVIFTRKLKDKYPDYNRYKCYHKLISSTPIAGVEYIEEDFEGEYSVIAFLEDLLKTS